MEIKDYAQILHWLLDGKKVQVQDQARKATWCKVCPKDALRWIGMGIAPAPQFFRLAPRTITINGVEIEAPVTGATDVYLWYTTACGNAFRAPPDNLVAEIKNGRAFATQEAAIAAHKAITAALTGKTEGRAE